MISSSSIAVWCNMGQERLKTSFDIHGLVRVGFDSRLRAKIKQVMHQLAEFEEPVGNGRTPDVIIRDYADVPMLACQTVIGDHYFYADGSLNIPSHKICYDLLGTPIRVYCDRFLLPVSLLIHLVLLRKSHALVHAAALEFGGRHYLFPALGGVGKTTLAAGVVFAGGKLYGDDMVIINSNEVLSYPQDFSVYPYHVALLRLNDRAIMRDFKKTALLNRITNVLERYDARPAKLVRVVLNSLKIPCVNVSPRRIFGGQCFAKCGMVDEIYYLSRTVSESKNLVVKRIEPRALAKVCTDILLHEWHESFRYLYAYSALSSFSLESIYSDTRAIFERLFTTRPCYSMEIPASMTNAEYQDELIRFLRTRSEIVDG